MTDGDTAYGASPVAWGEGPGPVREQARARCIPSRLGRGERGRRLRAGLPVHPQSPGERVRFRALLGAGRGASPVAWGEVARAGFPVGGVRCIPSRLGRGTRRSRPRCARTVHPQSPGERGDVRSVLVEVAGASPVAWGEGPGRAPRSSPPRCIPSRLGRGRRPPPAPRPPSVHPQSPGERAFEVTMVVRSMGASPVAWGEEVGHRGQRVGLGCIPSRLGRGSSSASSWRGSSVHPQSPGERTWHAGGEVCALGASPVAWGEGAGRLDVDAARRCIPSRLGRGAEPLRVLHSIPVHPQSPGERVASAALSPYCCGASPVAWGEGPRAGRLGRGPPVHPQSPGERAKDRLESHNLSKNPPS